MYIEAAATPSIAYHMHLQTVIAYKDNLSIIEGGGSGSSILNNTVLTVNIQISAYQIWYM